MATKTKQNLFLLIAMIFSLVNGVQVFDVYRLYQVDKASSSLGSQRVAVNLPAVSQAKTGSLSRQMVIVPYSELNSDSLDNLINTRNADGLLILLPKYTRRTKESQIESWRQLESDLLQRKFNIPVYFAWEDPALQDLYRDVDRVSGNPEAGSTDIFGGNQYQLVVTAPEATPVKEVTLTNFQSRLSGDGQQLPTIAIVAHYDTFGAVPAISSGDASGAVALLELSRLFSQLYENPKTKPKYNLLFLLNSGGNLNYAGSKHWLSATDVRLLENIEFALCLDEIDRSDEINLHVSRIAKEGNAVKLYESFNKTASALGVTLNYSLKKINVSNPDIDWEHEQFSRKKILAGTLSDDATSRGPLAKSHVYDVRERSEEKVLLRNIRFVAESIAKHIYGFHDKSIEIFEGSLEVNKDFVVSWLDALSRESRASPYIPKKSTLLNALEKTLSQNVHETTQTSFALTEGEWTFYDFASLKTTMSFYRSKPTSFDVILFIAIATYLIGLFALLKGPAEALKQVKQLFEGKKGIKKKN